MLCINIFNNCAYYSAKKINIEFHHYLFSNVHIDIIIILSVFLNLLIYINGKVIMFERKNSRQRFF